MSEFLKNKFNLTESQLNDFYNNVGLEENEIKEIFELYPSLSYQQFLDAYEANEIIQDRANSVNEIDLKDAWHISSNMTEEELITQFVKLFDNKMSREEIKEKNS